MKLGSALWRVIVCYAFRLRIHTSLMDGETECSYCFNCARQWALSTWREEGHGSRGATDLLARPHARTHAPVVVSIADLIHLKF